MEKAGGERGNDEGGIEAIMEGAGIVALTSGHVSRAFNDSFW